jgi:ATP-dependent DNA helicase RecG
LSQTILQNSVTTLRGVGEKLRLRLSEIGIYSLEDLLFHFPLRYQDRTRITPIGALADQIDAVVQGDIRGAAVTMGRRRTLVVQIGDDTGLITVRFFHFRQTQVAQFKAGGRITLFGTPRRLAGKVEMVHPEYRLGDDGQPVGASTHARLSHCQRTWAEHLAKTLWPGVGIAKEDPAR